VTGNSTPPPEDVNDNARYYRAIMSVADIDQNWRKRISAEVAEYAWVAKKLTLCWQFYSSETSKSNLDSTQ